LPTAKFAFPVDPAVADPDDGDVVVAAAPVPTLDAAVITPGTSDDVAPPTPINRVNPGTDPGAN